MILLTHRHIEHDLADVAGRSIHVSGAETRIEVAWGSGGWAWSYRRPSQVRLESDPTTTVALRDYVMLNRVAIVLIAFLLMTRRRV